MCGVAGSFRDREVESNATVYTRVLTATEGHKKVTKKLSRIKSKFRLEKKG